MDHEKSRFLFGVDVPDFHVDDIEQLVDYFDEVIESDAGDDIGEAANPYRLLPELLAVAAQRVLRPGDAAWPTAQRLTSLGLDRRQALDEIAFALRFEMLRQHQDSVGAFDFLGKHTLDDERLLGLYASLPLVSDDRMVAEIETFAAERPLHRADEFAAVVLERLGCSPTAELLHAQVDYTIEAGVEAGVLRFGPGDVVIHVPSIVAGIVLTHRLRDEEVRLDSLMFVSSDLAGFAWYEDLNLAGIDDPADDFEFDPTVIEVIPAGEGLVLWKLPESSLAEMRAGDIVAVAVDAFGVVTIERIDDPADDPAIVAEIAAAYAAETAELDLAVEMIELLTTVLAANADAFSKPTLPLTELCLAAGLEVRGSNVGKSAESWMQLQRARRSGRLFAAADGHVECAESAEDVLDALDAALASDDHDHVDDHGHDQVDRLRMALELLTDDHVARLVVDELISPDGVSEDPDRVRAAAERLIEVARRGPAQATAWWLRGVIEERLGVPLAAEECFVKGLSADPDSVELTERVGWYASDRGDAVAAVRLFQRLEDDHGEGRAIAAFAKPSGPTLGRNDACWCGSGRKFKACHLGVVEQPPLPDRVGWIMHKAFAYLRRHGGECVAAIVTAAAAWAGDDVGRVRDALDDPIVFDTVLVEGGWWERFLADRAALLPDDEVALIRQWSPVARSVYEVIDVQRGQGMDVRDLRTGVELAIRERQAGGRLRAGDVLLARAVPDGQGHQFVGAVQTMPASQAEYAISLCDDADGEAICGYVGALNAS